MRSSYDIGVKLTLGLEGNGNYTNDPDDPGKETRFGISKRYNPDVDIKNLTLEQAKEIYLKRYWMPAGCDNISFPMDICLFDSQVNPQNDPKWNFGGNLEILNQRPENWEDYNLLRMIRYKNNSKRKYVNGHIMRVIKLSEQIKQLEKENKMKKILISMLAVLMLLCSCTGLNVSVATSIATDTAFVLVLQNNPTYKAPVIVALKEVKAVLTGSLTYDDLIIQITKAFPAKYAVIGVVLSGYIAEDKPIFETYLPMLESYKAGILAKIDRFIILASI